jgi:hypothetical protein
MTAPKSTRTCLLRWYPKAWRDRYGDELNALLEDHLDGRRPTVGLRLAMARAGFREHGHHASLLGDVRPPAEQVRAGSLLVLVAWVVVVVAGASFAKLSEQFGASVPTGSRAVPIHAFTTVEVAAVTGAVLVVLGALAAIPSFVAFLSHGGWPAVRTPLLRASAVAVVAVAATLGLAGWAHSLSSAQRNGGDLAYGTVFGAWAALVVATLVLWTVVAVAAGRRLPLGRHLLAFEAAMAMLAALAMAVMAVATSVWWGSMAIAAPWFLTGAPTGTSGSPADPRMVVTMTLMVVAAALGVIGVVRIGRSWGRLRPA